MKHVRTSQYPLLTEFARGYLHQDAAEQYTSIPAALAAYLEDLTADERARMKRELEMFRRGRTSLAQWNGGLRELGAAFTLRDEGELRALGEVYDAGPSATDQG